MPAQAGIQLEPLLWIPAYAGMTRIRKNNIQQIDQLNVIQKTGYILIHMIKKTAIQ